MRWFWQRKRPRQTPVTEAVIPAPARAAATGVQRAPTTSGRLGQPRQLTSDLLLFARDYLQATGGHVRVEDEDVISATMPDGSLVRYTSTPAKARTDETATLLVEGSSALAAMLDDIAAHAHLTALRLASNDNPVALALEQCAAPVAKCGRCLESPEDANTASLDLCETCPLRDNRTVLRWRSPGSLSARVVGQEQLVSVELAYLVAARDRQGRRDEWMRLAVDGQSGRKVSTLNESALASAQPERVPVTYDSLLATACHAAERALAEPLTATGIFLRQRSLEEYRRRLEEVGTTFDRLQHESPDTARAAKAGRSRELSALSEVYAVDIEAQLESACFITSPHAIVAVRTQKARGELVMRIDLGRQQVIPPDCVTCGTAIQAGYVCDAGHPMCASCADACVQCGAWGCEACGEAPSATCATCGHRRSHPAEVDNHTDMPPADGVFTVHHLEALPPEMWLTAIEWILSRQGCTVDARRIAGGMAVLQGHTEVDRLMVVAIRPGRDWALGEITVRQAAAHMSTEQPAIKRMILATSQATAEASQLAHQLGIELVDRDALQAQLVALASAHDRAREREVGETQARADAACATQGALLDAIDAIERLLAQVRRSKRGNAGAATGVVANRSLAEARVAIERASLAWETLLADWADAFGERPTRNGRLLIQAESAHFAEMAVRSAHLQVALVEATTLLAATPIRGETGYTAWRQAVVDEWSARCDAWRWRIRTYDPAEWNDFTRAWNAKSAEKAAVAATAAGHATARADKAQSQALRAG